MIPYHTSYCSSDLVQNFSKIQMSASRNLNPVSVPPRQSSFWSTVPVILMLKASQKCLLSYKLKYRFLRWAFRAPCSVAPACLYTSFRSHQHALSSSQPRPPEGAEAVFIFPLFCCAPPLPLHSPPAQPYACLKASLQGLAQVASSSWNYPKNLFCPRIFIAHWYYHSFKPGSLSVW